MKANNLMINNFSQKIIYEDNHIIAVNKDASIPTVPDITGDLSLLEMAKEYLKIKYEKKGNVFLGVIHRIDRPVSGLVLFARTSKAASRLSEQIRDKTIEKKYLALVENKPPQNSGILKNYLLKDEKKNIVSVWNEKINDNCKLSITEWKFLRAISSQYGNIYLLEITPVTGRPHQIRAQLSHAGFPILGDKKYNSKKGNLGGKIALHSYSMGFKHPTKDEELILRTELPENNIWAEN